MIVKSFDPASQRGTSKYKNDMKGNNFGDYNYTINNGKNNKHNMEGRRSFYTFSYDNYWNPDKTGFGDILALNEHIVSPGSGFDMHYTANVDILLFPLNGELSYTDNLGNQTKIINGQFMILSTGRGLIHREMNDSRTEELKFLQINFEPKILNSEPSFHYFSLNSLIKRNQISTMVSPDSNICSKMNQNVYVSMCKYDKWNLIKYQKRSPANGVYVFVLEGKVQIFDDVLNAHDGYSIQGGENLSLYSLADSKALIIETPMY
ncbi:Quercetin 2,3-dioxygenase [Tritrichomonas foetus]|uniref:Quercetin 2,3-dioxygenase n=1 Tax=Tritrichomonas foetus TaxID=1144522 RepID=A0A1J4JRA5_9EUKA|nr:Quercetin 2,3-dioxygenase [Tritrichomonas foetus]|eukprot:OHS99796.1 Quercetin 2,3-dioxygenase [Tritrichomonas foetus]